MARAAKLRVVGRLLAAAPALPPRVAAFQAAALALALTTGDVFSLQSTAQPRQVAELIRLARGRDRVAELGTGTGWTAASLALSAPTRAVVSCDPVALPERDRYLRLLPRSARARLRLLDADGAAAATLTRDRVQLLFIDCTDEEQATIEQWRAWRPRLAPAAVVVLHDYANPTFPGVAGAVRALGLRGEVREGMFVWRQPAPRGA